MPVYAEYILALSDAQKVDCKLDPEGFRASLDEAKQKFKELNSDRQNLRSTIKQDLKATLMPLSGN